MAEVVAVAEEEEVVAAVAVAEEVVARYFAIYFGHVSRRIHVGAEGSSKHRKLR